VTNSAACAELDHSECDVAVDDRRRDEPGVHHLEDVLIFEAELAKLAGLLF